MCLSSLWHCWYSNIYSCLYIDGVSQSKARAGVHEVECGCVCFSVSCNSSRRSVINTHSELSTPISIPDNTWVVLLAGMVHGKLILPQFSYILAGFAMCFAPSTDSGFRFERKLSREGLPPATAASRLPPAAKHWQTPSSSTATSPAATSWCSGVCAHAIDCVALAMLL